MLFALIPYITIEDDAAEVWIVPVTESPTTPEAVVAILAEFASEDPANREAIADHCDAWRADRILLPDTSGTRWCSYWIADALENQLVETY